MKKKIQFELSELHLTGLTSKDLNERVEEFLKKRTD